MTSSATQARDRIGVALAVDRAFAAGAASIKALDYTNVASSDVRMGAIFGSLASDSGAVVTEASAMRVTAVYAAVRLIAGTVATLPWHIYRRTDDGSRDRVDHDLWWLLNEQACPAYTSCSMWMFGIAQTLLRGDGLVMIDRANPYTAAVRSLIPLKRELVSPFRMEGGRIGYRVFDPTIDGGKGGYFTLMQDDVLHFTGDFFNGLTSMSVIQTAARQSVGISLRADQHAAKAFGEGSYLQHVLKAAKTMTPKMQDELRAAFVAKYQGGAGASGIPLILTEGMEIDSISLTPADQQLLETRRYQNGDIARAFGVPPHMIGDVEKSTSWGTGIEQMYLGFIRGQLPLINRITQELNRKLFTRAGMFIEPDLSALTAGDAKTQADYYQRALGGPGAQGWMKLNEVRRKLNLPPVPGGDEVIKATAAIPPAAPGKPTEDAPDAPDGDDAAGKDPPAAD